MKKVILLLLIFGLFFSASIFAEGDNENKTDNEEFYSVCLKYNGADDSKKSAEFK